MFLNQGSSPYMLYRLMFLKSNLPFKLFKQYSKPLLRFTKRDYNRKHVDILTIIVEKLEKSSNYTYIQTTCSSYVEL